MSLVGRGSLRRSLNELYDYIDARLQGLSESTADVERLTGNQTVGGIKTFSSMPRIPVGANVAAAGADQAGAAALVEGAQVVTGANGSLGVRLPVAGIGAIVIIKGTTSGVLLVYPDTGAAINAVAANSAMSLASGVIPALFWKHTATQWYTLPLLPS